MKTTISVQGGWWDLEGRKAREKKLGDWLVEEEVPHEWQGETIRKVVLDERDAVKAKLAGHAVKAN